MKISVPYAPEPWSNHRLEVARLVFEVIGSDLGIYHVTRDASGSWRCDCGDFIHRRSSRGEYCKHITRIRVSLSQPVEVLATHLGEPVL